MNATELVNSLLEGVVQPVADLDQITLLLVKAARAYQKKDWDVYEVNRKALRSFNVVLLVKGLSPTQTAMSYTSKGGENLIGVNANLFAHFDEADVGLWRVALGHEFVHKAHHEKYPLPPAASTTPVAYFEAKAEVMAFAYSIVHELHLKLKTKEGVFCALSHPPPVTMPYPYGEYRYYFKKAKPEVWAQFNRYLFHYAQQLPES